ncbi:MAG TPA: signal peptidase I [Fimbriimonas sp.]|nr:signal peptidase I [Fimbriimonas sp.]
MEESVTNEIPQKRKRPVRAFTIFLVITLFISIFCFASFKTAVVRGESMKPTLDPGRKVLTSKAYWLIGAIKKNDIIVLQEEKSEDYFIKRVIGLPGDQIKWTYAPWNWPLTNGPYIVPEGKIYVVGDNLNHSDDSRKFGAFDQSKILGKVLTWR